jgi:Na+/proline symporter
MYQRFFASESVNSAKKATFYLFFAIVILESLIIANAWISSSMITDIPKESHVLIYAAYNFLPPIVGAVMLATIIGIIISTADSFLLVPTTILINDIYLKYSKKQYSDKMIVTLSRLLVLLLGFFSYWVSRMFAADTTIFEKALYAFTIYGTAITPTLLAAFFWDKATKYGAICSIISGIVATVYFGNQWSLDEAVIPALAISSAALVLISYIPKSD